MGTKTSSDDGAGCLVVIAIALITIGGGYVWGPMALVVIGAIILAMVILG